MSNFDALDRREVAYCLIINGLPHRYYGKLAPGLDLQVSDVIDWDGNVVLQPSDVEALVDVGPIRASIDDFKGMATQEPVVVKVRASDARVSGGGRVDPADTLLRVAGHHAADRSVRLLTSLSHTTSRDGPVDVEATADVSGWALPGLIHIGQEVLWADAAAGIGSDANPYRFTGCTRAADGHSTQAHEVDATANEQPWVTSDVTTWRGRYARIYVTAIVGGEAYAWRQYWAGFIDSAPEEEDDGTISIRIASLAQVARYRLGVGSASRTATAVPGAHLFTPGHADTIKARVAYFISQPLRWTATDTVASTITLTADSATIFDSLTRTAGLRLQFDGQSGVPTAWASPVLTFAAASALVAAVDAATPGDGELMAVGDARDTLPLRLFEDDGSGTFIVQWPKALQDAINTANAWQPGAYDSWADPDGAGGAESFWRMSLVEDASWVLTAAMYQVSGIMLQNPAFHLYRGGDTVNWAGWAAGEGVSDIRSARLTMGQRVPGVALPIGPISSNLFYDDAPHRFPIDGPAAWFYQSGEKWIGPFSRSLYTAPAGTAQTLKVTGPGTDATVHIVGEMTGTHPTTGATVYWYEVDPRRRESTPSVVMMPSDEAFTAQVVAGVADSDPPNYLLRLFMSGTGNGDNGAHDLLPIGANLPDTLIDSRSFLAMAVPGPLHGQDYTAVRGKTIEDQVEGLLLACGCQVVARYSEAADRWRISLAHMGPADSALDSLAIVHADLEARDGRRRVTTRFDGRVARSFKLLMNYPADGSDPVPIELAGTSEAADTGGDSGSPMTIELRGVRTGAEGDTMQAAIELVSDVRARVGAPRMRWEFAIRADMPGAPALGIGSTVRLTSSDARAINPTQTVSAVPCRAVGLTRDLDANRLTLEVRPYGGIGAGYAPSLRVESVVDADTVVVEADAFSDDDLSRFAVDDAVACIPLGDWSGRNHRVISTINTGTRNVSFTVNHGLAVGDVIRLDDYDTATGSRAALAGFAFLADDADTLGAGAVVAQVIG